MADVDDELDLNSLRSGRPGITAAEGGFQAECAAVCLERAGHSGPPTLAVQGKWERQFLLSGPEVDDQMRRSFADATEATEYGATAVAILVVERCERLTVWERSAKDGGGFDYYLTPDEASPAGEADEPENFLAAATSRLEVSGILKGSTDDVRYRWNAKMRRATSRPGRLPLLVAVVEFGAPLILLG